MEYGGRTDIMLDRENDSGVESNSADMDDAIYIRISVPDLKLQKCLKFEYDATVYAAKLKVLNTLAKDLKDGLNYGLYSPPANGRAGKFLEEERYLREYPLAGPIGFLELKYKRRVYKLMNINPRKLKQIHTKSNLRQFLESVRAKDLDKVTKFCNRGLDPNFHEKVSGETPLTIAVQMNQPRSLILTLVSGGAHLDYRARDSLTPMHKAAIKGNQQALKTLLDLGASPNYKDLRNTTPVYYCCSNDTNEQCVQMLLHDHATLGATDERGWTEVHQVCKYGRQLHLEHLIFYGANVNCQNATGNTPLHVCAAHNQESCARLLLFRGASRTILNYSNQDAYQTAVIAGNHVLADDIKNFKDSDVVPLKEVPRYNEKRRGQLSDFRTNLVRSRSDPRLNESMGDFRMLSGSQTVRELPHFRSNGNLIDAVNEGVMANDRGPDRSMSVSSLGSGRPRVLLRTTRCLSYSGPHTSLQGTQRGMEPIYEQLTSCSSRRLYLAEPGSLFICTKPFMPQDPGDLELQKGDIVEVISVGEQGYWEGRNGNKEGWFPSNHVGPIQKISRQASGSSSKSGTSDSIVIDRDTLAALAKGEIENEPRMVVLQRGKGGFGFVLRGAKSHDASTKALDFTPTPDFPGLQYLDRVEKDSMADKAGLKSGDFLLEINGEDVRSASHEHTVNLIKKSGDTLAMKVVTVRTHQRIVNESKASTHADGTQTLPLKRRAAPAPPTRDPRTSLSVSRSQGQVIADGVAAIAQTKSWSDCELPPTLPATRKFWSQCELLPTLPAVRNFWSDYTLDQAISQHDDSYSLKTASIGRRHGKRMSTIEMNDIFDRENTSSSMVDTQRSASNLQKPVVNDIPRMYSPDSQRLHEHNEYASHITRVDINSPEAPVKGVHGEFGRTVVDVHSVSSEDSSSQGYGSDSKHVYAVPHKAQRPPRRKNSIESSDSSGGSAAITQRWQKEKAPTPVDHEPAPPAPDYPPPNPPQDPAHMVQITPKSSPYASVSRGVVENYHRESVDIESSFRPGVHAQMSKEPDMATQRSRSSSGSSAMSGRAADDMKTGTAFAITAIASQHHHALQQQYCEPKPDYDRDAAMTPSQPHPRPARETTVTQMEPPAPTPDYDDEKESVSSFNSAIKQAALAREKRRQEQETAPEEPAVEVNNLRQLRKSAPPPPPKSSPPSDNMWPKPARHVPREGPSSLQKQMEEERKRDKGREDLMAAIAKRRTVVDNADMEKMAESIDKKVEQSRKVQSTVYTHSQPPVSPTKTSPAETPVKAPPPPSPPSTEVRQDNRMVYKAVTVQEEPKEETKEEPMDFLALAEKKRQEWLLKRQASNAGTLEKKPKARAPSPPSLTAAAKAEVQTEEVTRREEVEREYREEVKQEKTVEVMEREVVSQAAITGSSNALSRAPLPSPPKPAAPSRPAGMADFANMVAQRAATRQRSTEGDIEDKRRSGTTIFSSVGGPIKSPTSPKHEVQGATVDASYTETLGKKKKIELDANTPSVLARSKMLEGKIAPRTSPAGGNKLVFKAKPTSPTSERPPPMIPPPDRYHNQRSTVYSSKNNVVNGSYEENGLAHIAVIDSPTDDIPIVPPPPMFEEEIPPPFTSRQEDNASVVSSLSTLSSLSSPANESPRHSNNRTGYYEVAPPPPPPEFGDSTDFPPPPNEFIGDSTHNLRSVTVKRSTSHSMSFPAVTNPKAFKSKPPRSWTKEDVGHWLDSVNMSEYKAVFLKQGITGADLGGLGRREFSSMGITHVGKRMELEKAIRQAIES